VLYLPNEEVLMNNRRVGKNERRVGISGDAAAGAGGEWEEIAERRVGKDERRVGTSAGGDGTGKRRVGKNERRVGISGGAAAGASGEWEEIAERRVGKDERRVGTSTDGDGISITENQRRILDSAAADPRVTTVKLAEIVGISARKIEENVRKLKERGLIERVGARKNGYWVVKPLGR
jgi:biotin operon repressor